MIAAYGERVVMKETLAEALAALFVDGGAAQAIPGTTEQGSPTGKMTPQAREALDRYNQRLSD